MIEKSYAKVNVFLKITGTKEYNGNNYHTFNSRFILVENLYDTISFVPQTCEKFTIEGLNNIDLEKNIIYKAFKLLNIETGDLNILDFFHKHKVVVKKSIPMGAGLGGGSSNAATFLRMVNSTCNLKIPNNKLATMGAKLGADVPFFINGFSSANVSGFGEKITEFIEEPLSLDIFTPPLHSNTADVYRYFRDHFLNDVSSSSGSEFLNMNSKDILSSGYSLVELNDLYGAAKELYVDIEEYNREGYYFSGSGSSFFKIKEDNGI